MRAVIRGGSNAGEVERPRGEALTGKNLSQRRTSHNMRLLRAVLQFVEGVITNQADTSSLKPRPPFFF